MNFTIFGDIGRQSVGRLVIYDFFEDFVQIHTALGYQILQKLINHQKEDVLSFSKCINIRAENK